jgi:hypothetical protein
MKDTASKSLGKAQAAPRRPRGELAGEALGLILR